MDFDTIKGVLEWSRRIGSWGPVGLRPRVIAVVLIAATAAYASVDLSMKIRRAAGPFPQIEKAALPAAEASAGRKAFGQSDGKQAIEAYQVIAARNLFGSTDKEVAGTGGGLLAEGLEQSALQLDLIGTIAGEDDKTGRAVIDDRKKARSYKVGDQVAGATLVKIMRNSVVLRVDGREEVLNMKVRQSQSPRSAAGQRQVAVQTPGRERSTGVTAAVPPATGGVPGTVRDILNQAGARPHFESGKMDGFYIGRVAEGSLLKKYGLENGDIIEGINDQPLQKPDDIFNLQNMKSAQGGKTVLKIKRQGRPMTLNLNME